ncbi:Membrane-associated tyrosine- and threonine-specific cdc2-inhibitory kinase [Armadillidium nasatum]|uniref:non-specific serine/threonine protein kinase n=1 Tax=Armadillidium nasatum TaxID=96803 RepID=A0A5N5SLC6_9CRUS|nr:Membrane-associated tyrosine- and threonine-specific cdc2-inhibitory kinase [Armadillidium nasatum]
MASYPLPVFYDLEQTLSTKKERKSMFSNYGRPPKAPVRSAPVRRIYSVYKDEAPKPVSFREGSDQSFITGSPLYSSKKGTYFEQCYEIESRLGEGDFGEVFKVVSKENGKHYACKRNILKFRGERDRTRRIQEVKNHEQLTPHVNIIKFYRAWEENNQLYLLTEVCKQSLADILYNTHEFPENQIWAYFIDILQGLDHLHLHKCIHMDVKPENIFIGLDGRCKLGDFGLVIDFSNGYPTEALDGDSKYLAPECLQRVYTPAADIFSLGIVLLEMATDLDLPKRGPLWHELRTGHIPSMEGRGLSLELRSTIKWLMEPDYRKRPTTTEVLNYKAVKRLSRKNNVIYFFRSKVQTFNSYISKFFILPFIFCSFIYVNLKKKLLNYEEKCYHYQRLDTQWLSWWTILISPMMSP